MPRMKQREEDESYDGKEKKSYRKYAATVILSQIL